MRKVRNKKRSDLLDERLGRRLKAIREQKGKTQREIGKLWNASQATVSRIERGVQPLEVGRLVDFCADLEVRIDELVHVF